MSETKRLTPEQLARYRADYHQCGKTVMPLVLEVDALTAERDEARKRAEHLADAIRTHRAQHADDRCWMDDFDLYSALDDGVAPDNRVGDKEAMLANCRRFIETRCAGGKWASYAELEADVARLRALLLAACRAAPDAVVTGGDTTMTLAHLARRLEERSDG